MHDLARALIAALDIPADRVLPGTFATCSRTLFSADDVVGWLDDQPRADHGWVMTTSTLEPWMPHGAWRRQRVLAAAGGSEQRSWSIEHVRDEVWLALEFTPDLTGPGLRIREHRRARRPFGRVVTHEVAWAHPGDDPAQPLAPMAHRLIAIHAEDP